jgi:transcriptional regulator with XRE-family HTH domain
LQLGLSQGGLAERLAAAPSTVARTERGESTPHPYNRRRWAKALEISLEELDELLGTGESPAPASWERYIRAVEDPARVDAVVVDNLAAVLAADRQMEDSLGPRLLIRPVAARLEVIDRLAVGCRSPIRDAVVTVLGQYAQFVGWMLEDVGNTSGALAAYDRAMDAAQQTDDQNMVVSVLSLKSHTAWSDGDGPRALAMAQAGLRAANDWTSPGVRALVTQQAARGHAMLGNADEVERMLDITDKLTQRAHEHPEDEPPWAYFVAPERALYQRGAAYAELRRYTQAADLIDASRHLLPEHYRRDHARYMAASALMRARAGDIDQAVASASRAAELALETGSARAARDLRRLREELTRWNDTPSVRHLDEIIRTLVPGPRSGS